MFGLLPCSNCFIFALLPPLLVSTPNRSLSPSLCVSLCVGATCSFQATPSFNKRDPETPLSASTCSKTTLALDHVQESHLHSMDGPFRMVSKWLYSTTINPFISQQLSLSCFHILRLWIRRRTSPAHAQGAEARCT